MEDATEPVAGTIEEPGIQTSTSMSGGHNPSPAYNVDHLESVLDTNEMNSATNPTSVSEPGAADNAGHMECAVDPEQVLVASTSMSSCHIPSPTYNADHPQIAVEPDEMHVASVSASGCRNSHPSTADNAGHIDCAVDPEKVPVEKRSVVTGKRATFSCHTCTKTFRSEKLFLRHQKNVHNTDTAGAYWCLHCEYCTANKSKYYQHTLIHVEGRFKCEECQKTFKRRAHLVNHRVTHTKEKKFPCSICDQSFTKRYNLVRHERVMHLGVGADKNACETCGRCFNRADNLARHQMVHTRGRPFRCDKCPKGYRHRSNLKKHVEKMHPPTPSPYAYLPCGGKRLDLTSTVSGITHTAKTKAPPT